MRYHRYDEEPETPDYVEHIQEGFMDVPEDTLEDWLIDCEIHAENIRNGVYGPD